MLGDAVHAFCLRAAIAQDSLHRNKWLTPSLHRLVCVKLLFDRAHLGTDLVPYAHLRNKSSCKNTVLYFSTQIS